MLLFELEWTEVLIIAAALLAERDFNPEEQALLLRDDGKRLPWGMAISWTMSPERAARTVEQFAVARASWWLPLWLMWICDGLRAGQPLAWAVRELDELLAYLRSVVVPGVTP